MLPVLLGMGQKCPKCGQRSSPRVGQGNWEIMGVWNSCINRCTKRGRLLRIGFLSDERLAPQESEAFLKAKAAHRGE